MNTAMNIVHEFKYVSYQHGELIKMRELPIWRTHDGADVGYHLAYLYNSIVVDKSQRVELATSKLRTSPIQTFETNAEHEYAKRDIQKVLRLTRS